MTEIQANPKVALPVDLQSFGTRHRLCTHLQASLSFVEIVRLLLSPTYSGSRSPSCRYFNLDWGRKLYRLPSQAVRSGRRSKDGQSFAILALMNGSVSLGEALENELCIEGSVLYDKRGKADRGHGHHRWVYRW